MKTLGARALLGGSRPRSTPIRLADRWPVAREALLRAIGDDDRRVRTEAVRALGTYTDASSLIQLILLLQDDDPWIAVTAADGIGSRGDRARAAIPELVKATGVGNSPWVRGAAIAALAEVWLPTALAPAMAMAKDTSLTVRVAAADVLAKLKVGGRAGLMTLRNDPDRDLRATANTAWLQLADTIEDAKVQRAARKSAFASRDVAVRAAAARSIAAWADSSDIPTLLDAYAVRVEDSAGMAQEATIEALADIESRGGKAAAAFFARFRAAPSDIAYGMAGRAFGPKTLAAWGSGRPVHSTRTDADYKRIVETLIVPRTTAHRHRGFGGRRRAARRHRPRCARHAARDRLPARTHGERRDAAISDSIASYQTSSRSNTAC